MVAYKLSRSAWIFSIAEGTGRHRRRYCCTGTGTGTGPGRDITNRNRLVWIRKWFIYVREHHISTFDIRNNKFLRFTVLVQLKEVQARVDAHESNHSSDIAGQVVDVLDQTTAEAVQVAWKRIGWLFAWLAKFWFTYIHCVLGHIQHEIIHRNLRRPDLEKFHHTISITNPSFISWIPYTRQEQWIPPWRALFRAFSWRHHKFSWRDQSETHRELENPISQPPKS